MNGRRRQPPSPVTALVLGWAIPGAGHAYQGRWGKAVLFFVLIVGLLVSGFALGRGTNVRMNEWWFAAQVGAGGPAIALAPLSQHFERGGPIDWADPQREMGTLYTAIAGFLNILVMMDAYNKLAYPPKQPSEETE